MTIFFDTTELKKNPLFYNHSMEIFFELSKAEEIKIYISEIVLSYELKKHYIEDFKEKLKLYNEASEKFYKLWDNKYNEKVYNNNEIKSNFENRISKLIKDNYFTKVEFDRKNIIDSMLDRYMESKAPFHKINKNDEKDYNWKDYIIWESYKTIMNNGKDKEHIFISNNTKDFSDEKLVENCEGIYTMHNDFYQDIKGKVIRCYTDIFSFLYQDKEYQDIYKKYLIKKYKKSNNDKSIIEELLLFTSKFVDKFLYKSDNSYSINKINIPDYIDIKTNGIKNNININITIDNKNNLKTGGVDKNVNNKKQKNMDKDRNNQNQKDSYEEKTIHTKCSFTLDLQKLEFKISSICKFESKE